MHCHEHQTSGSEGFSRALPDPQEVLFPCEIPALNKDQNVATLSENKTLMKSRDISQFVIIIIRISSGIP